MATPSMLRRAVAWLVTILTVALIGIQFIRPELPKPPVTAEIEAPPEVKAILKNSCYNCHSNETKLSWFDKPAPGYWMVVRDVRKARKHLNFSEFGNLPAAQQKAILYEAVSHIELGAMPLPAYKRFHPESVVTPQQLAILKKYLGDASAQSTPATPVEIAAADAQYNKWIRQASATQTIAPAPNGFAFLPDYKNWRAISSTERFDNHTLRQVLGNDVAIKAIAENHFNPWPDGTAFAKVAWFEQADEKGVVRPGEFFQVEFMLRDSQKYAATLGWGWGRWRGEDPKPYGKDATFTNECVECHSPLRKTDYVFSEPIRGQQ